MVTISIVTFELVIWILLANYFTSLFDFLVQYIVHDDPNLLSSLS